MADESDVEIALARLIAALLYPGGLSGVGGYDTAPANAWSLAGAYGSVPPGNSAAGLPVRIYRGWPAAQQLDPDLAAGIAHVTIFKGSGMGRLAAGTIDGDISIAGPPPAISLTVADNTVTLRGSPSPYTLVGLVVEGTGYPYQVQARDTLFTIASALAATIGGAALTTQTGAVIVDLAGNPITIGEFAAVTQNPDGSVTLTIATSAPIVARAATFGTSTRRSRQQTVSFKVTAWAPNPAARDNLCRFVDAALAEKRWLMLADQAAWMLWAGSIINDAPSKAALWRRDMTYNVTYYTTTVRTVPPMLFGVRVQLVAGAQVRPTTTTT